MSTIIPLANYNKTMILISHRGNIEGRIPDHENHPNYITDALSKNYDVEVDVSLMDGEFYLGHDTPEYKISVEFLKNEKLWCHAKNIDALFAMIKEGSVHCFWHQNDAVTLTSQKYIWTFPGQILTPNSICVLPEKYEHKELNCAGICSDYISQYDNLKIQRKINEVM
jgi:hypothetical protein